MISIRKKLTRCGFEIPGGNSLDGYGVECGSPAEFTWQSGDYILHVCAKHDEECLEMWEHNDA